MASKIVDFPHKSPQAFSMCFILTDMLFEKLPRMSHMRRLCHSQCALIVEFLRVGSHKRKCTFVNTSSHFNSSKPQFGCHINPHSKHTTFSLYFNNRLTYKSSRTSGPSGIFALLYDYPRISHSLV